MSGESENDTLVAFVDISGFKSYLDSGVGREVLSDFYNTGAKVLRCYNSGEMSQNSEIKGILVSDCAILYMSEDGGLDPDNWLNQLLSMLYLVRDYNIKMLEQNYLLTCSIACGPCDYEPRFDDEYTRKNSLVGQGYVRAFTDNEYGMPKIQAGECRIITEGFPDFPELFSSLNDDHGGENTEAFLRPYNNLQKSDDGRHIHYYWMLSDHSQINEFANEITCANKRMYEGLKQIFKKYAGISTSQL